MCIEKSLLSALYIFNLRLLNALKALDKGKKLANTISFNIIDGLDSAAQFSAASRHQSPDIDLRLKLDERQSEEGFRSLKWWPYLLHDIPWQSSYPAAPNYRWPRRGRVVSTFKTRHSANEPFVGLTWWKPRCLRLAEVVQIPPDKRLNVNRFNIDVYCTKT